MLVGPFEGSVIEVRGADRRSYLDDVTTQQLGDLEEGQARAAMVLDAHGAPLAVFTLLAGSDADLLLAPTGADRYVMDTLATRTFLADVTFRETDHQAVSVRGQDVDAVLTQLLGSAPDEDRWWPGEVSVVRHAFGAEAVGPPDAVQEWVRRAQDAGATVASGDEIAQARIEMGEPTFGREIAAPHLPEELGLLPTHVHLAKGCYPGQEAVARMWMLGRPRRRLAQVVLTGDWEPGEQVGTGRAKIEVTAIGTDGRSALAFVPADAEPGVEFADDDRAVQVVRLVGADRDQPGRDPNVRRRRDRTR